MLKFLKNKRSFRARPEIQTSDRVPDLESEKADVEMLWRFIFNLYLLIFFRKFTPYTYPITFCPILPSYNSEGCVWHLDPLNKYSRKSGCTKQTFLHGCTKKTFLH